MKKPVTFKKCDYCGQFLPKELWEDGVHGDCELDSFGEAMEGCALTEDECDAFGLPFPNITSPF
ncbi:MAG: hypothetical protein Q7R61_00515 [bacterium]|nr:hypothetical protein [bacterium]